MVRASEFPYITRLLLQLIMEGLNQELEALRDSGIPLIDAFIDGDDPEFRRIVEYKRRESVANYFLKGYTGQEGLSDVLRPSYELAYVRRKSRLRARIGEWNPREEALRYIMSGGGDYGGEEEE